MPMELHEMVKYLVDNLNIELKFDLRTETINVELFLGDNMICDSSMPIPQPKVSWS